MRSKVKVKAIKIYSLLEFSVTHSKQLTTIFDLQFFSLCKNRQTHSDTRTDATKTLPAWPAWSALSEQVIARQQVGWHHGLHCYCIRDCKVDCIECRDDTAVILAEACSADDGRWLPCVIVGCVETACIGDLTSTQRRNTKDARVYIQQWLYRALSTRRT